VLEVGLGHRHGDVLPVRRDLGAAHDPHRQQLVDGGDAEGLVGRGGSGREQREDREARRPGSISSQSILPREAGR
jgi:hypothetical protein